MNQISESMLLALSRCATADETLAVLAKEALHLGFDFFAYGLRHPLPLTAPRIAWLNNYPPPWQLEYSRNGFLDIDPTIHHGQRSQSPILWSDELFRNTWHFWESARAFGLRVGWSRAFFDRHGVIGMLSLSRSATPLSTSELAALDSRMDFLMAACREFLAPTLLPDSHSPSACALSHREVEILKWIGDGKTSAETAAILNLAVDTVNYHLKKAITKLGAANRTGAVIKAALQGLLD